MAVAHKGAISFGLVYIPVSLHTAIQDNKASYNQLHKADNARVRYKKVCGGCGAELAAADIVRGYEYAPGQYVTVDDVDLEAVKTPRDKSFTIETFVDLAAIDPIYFSRTYYAVPDTGGNKAFELLRQALQEEDKVAIAKTVMSERDQLLAIRATENALLVELMHYPEEIKKVPIDFERPVVSESELAMAKTLIDSMVSDFKPDQYHNQYQARVQEMLQRKIAGEQITVSTQDAEKPVNIVDLMAALAASVAEQRGAGEQAKKGTGAGA